jgi:hypothetical protein
MGYAARWMGYRPVYTDYINREQQLAYDLKEVDMTEFKCDTRSHGNFLYGRNSLCLLFYTDCIIIVWSQTKLPSYNFLNRRRMNGLMGRDNRLDKKVRVIERMFLANGQACIIMQLLGKEGP